ncbi:hypothetical protein NHX12_017976 [Muraenolepis orangiensis]|uniref:Uncharacterized protein n=1 Tax=Muraenolepis orangiensis TaxID=630683 RepID=A0A9Q0F0C3_9TELE|nr:hypothetical protein NHX12_017976 [Muraenolepis orangiensis]
MFLGRIHLSTAGEPESESTMLASPLTSTPFSVKDILKMEQQQQQQQQQQSQQQRPPRLLEHQHQRSPHSEIGQHHHPHQRSTHSNIGLHHDPHQQLQHFQAPPSCMLVGTARDSPPFSEGEDNLAYLSALAVPEEPGDASLSPDIMYGVVPGALGLLAEPKLEAVEPGESSKFDPAVLLWDA